MATRLLVAYDGSGAADAAVTAAGRLFAGAGGRLLTIIEPPPGPARVQAYALGLDAEVIERELALLGQELMDDGRDIAARGLEVAAAAGLTLESQVALR